MSATLHIPNASREIREGKQIQESTAVANAEQQRQCVPYITQQEKTTVPLLDASTSNDHVQCIPDVGTSQRDDFLCHVCKKQYKSRAGLYKHTRENSTPLAPKPL